MTRTITASMVTAIQTDHQDYCHLYEFQFSGGTERFTDAPVDISWDSQTWTALGGHIGYEAIRESPQLKSQGVRVTLDGVDTTIITHVLGENYIGRVAIIRLVHFSGGAVVGDPVTVFSGYMNGDFQIQESIGNDSTCKVTTTLASKMAQFSQVRGIKANVTSHQEHYNSDTFFSHITAMVHYKQIWGGYIRWRPPEDTRPDDWGDRP